MATEYVPKGTTDLTAYFGATNDVIIAEGSQFCSAGLDHSGANGPANVYINRAFTGTIGGGGGDPLHTEVTGTLLYDAGGGSLSLYPHGGAANLVAKLIQSGLGALRLVTGGTVTSLEIKSGSDNYIADTVTVTNLYVTGGSTRQLYKATANTILSMGGGTLHTGRSITTGEITGGSLIVRREDTSATVPTATTLTIGDAAVKWHGGAITTLNLSHPNARFDWSDMPVTATIGTVAGYVEAITRSGLRAGNGNVSKAGKTITVTALSSRGGDPSSYASSSGSGGSLSPQ